MPLFETQISPPLKCIYLFIFLLLKEQSFRICHDNVRWGFVAHVHSSINMDIWSCKD